MSNKRKVLGVLGGLGPMSSVYFYEMLTEHTKADCDNEHIDVIINSRASTPDRTAYILDNTKDDPGVVLARDAVMLENMGAEIIAMTCNTAHRFYDIIEKSIKIPFINMIKETVKYCKALGVRHIGLMATDGTVLSGSYNVWCEKYGIDISLPDSEDQRKIMNIIYGDIKSGGRPDMESFMSVKKSLTDKGCRKIILACTELSLIKREGKLDNNLFIDPMEILCCQCIMQCGGKIKGFEDLHYE